MKQNKFFLLYHVFLWLVFWDSSETPLPVFRLQTHILCFQAVLVFGAYVCTPLKCLLGTHGGWRRPAQPSQADLPQ